jgi:hypothetical protein
MLSSKDMDGSFFYGFVTPGDADSGDMEGI